MNTYPVPEKKYCMINPYTSLIVYLFFDTVHLIKNFRNNLIASRFFQIPQLQLELRELTLIVPSGNVFCGAVTKFMMQTALSISI